MDTDSKTEAARRKRSALVTTAAWLLLLPGLLFSLGLVKDGVQLLQGPPPAPFRDPQLQTFAAGYRQMSFVINLVWVLLLIPAALTLFRRWRHARIHATVAVLGVCAILAWGLTLSRERPAGGQLTVLAVWGVWAVFILASIWRPAAAKDFAAAGGEG
jgi:hypothetical protein